MSGIYLRKKKKKKKGICKKKKNNKKRGSSIQSINKLKTNKKITSLPMQRHSLYLNK